MKRGAYRPKVSAAQSIAPLEISEYNKTQSYNSCDNNYQP